MDEHGDDTARLDRSAARPQFNPAEVEVFPFGQGDPGTLERFLTVTYPALLGQIIDSVISKNAGTLHTIVFLLIGLAAAQALKPMAGDMDYLVRATEARVR